MNLPYTLQNNSLNIVDSIVKNCSSIEQDFIWLEELVNARIQELDNQMGVVIPQLPNLTDSYYSIHIKSIVQYIDSEISVRLLMVLSLSQNLKQEILEKMYSLDTLSNKIYNPFKIAVEQGYYYPTLDTFLFLLLGSNLTQKIIIKNLLTPDSFLLKNQIIEFHYTSKLNKQNPIIQLSEEYYQLLTTNQPYQYQYSEDFPASLYTTEETWDDLILPDRTRFYLQDIPVWMKHYNTIIQEDTYKKFTKGMKFLLHGEPGTGKSVCVALFGRDFGKPVYRIDLSQVVSKWVGETSKNMGKIFDIAKNKDWILFFDEGDALFGKRTENNSANDRYGNQEIAYLLQRMEEHKGIIFMATNKLPNMDKAFVRRFQVRVPFPIPDANTRYDIWCETFKGFPLEKVNFEYFAANVDNTGASIRSFGRYCKLWMLEKDLKKLSQDDLMELLQTHLEHEGKLWSPNR